jgi:hypothetical protein
MGRLEFDNSLCTAMSSQPLFFFFFFYFFLMMLHSLYILFKICSL